MDVHKVGTTRSANLTIIIMYVVPQPSRITIAITDTECVDPGSQIYK